MKLDLQANDIVWWALVNQKGNISLFDWEDFTFKWGFPIESGSEQKWKGGRHICKECKRLNKLISTMGAEYFPYFNLLIPEDFQE